MGIIYKTINLVNNKWYIGMDSKNDPSYLEGLKTGPLSENHKRKISERLKGVSKK